MTDTATLLSTLREKGVRLWVAESSLKISAPVGALDAEMRADLAAHKQEILAFLTEAEALKSLPPAIVPVKPGTRRPPLFVIPGHAGDMFYLLGLARHLDPEQPVLGVQPPGLDGGEPLRSIEALARYETEQIRRYRPNGPYLLAGHCSGGALAFEIAQQLTEAGQQVSLLAMLGAPFPTMFRRAPQTVFWLRRHANALSSGSLAEAGRYVASKALQRLRLVPPDPDSLADNYAMRARDNPALAVVDPARLEARKRVEEATVAACRAYHASRYDGRLDLFVTSDKWHGAHRWRTVAENIHEHDLRDFNIDDLILGSRVPILAASLQDTLDQVTSDRVMSRPLASAPRPRQRVEASS
jgi:thioesterase domain-containing protein